MRTARRNFLIILLASIWSGSTLAQEYTAWQTSREKSAITDVESFYGVVQSENLVTNVIGRDEPATMSIMCYENETRVQFNFNNYMGSAPIAIRYRIDGGKVVRSVVQVSADGRAFGYWRGSGTSLLKSLIGKSKLVVSAEPYNEGPREAIFPIKGIENVLTDIRRACGW